MGLIHWLYRHLTGKEAPRDLPDEWKEPSRFQKVSIIIVGALLVLAAVAHKWFPGVPGPRSDVPNVEPWALDVYLFWGAVSWASLSLIVFAMNRKWSHVLVSILWYAVFAALAVAYFLTAYWNACLRPEPAAAPPLPQRAPGAILLSAAGAPD